MALFGGKQKTERLMEELAQNLADSEVLSVLLRDIHAHFQQPDLSWLGRATGYYDERSRTVLVDEDGIMIYNCPYSVISNLSQALRRAKRAARWDFTENQIAVAMQRRAEAQEASDELSNQEYVSFNYTRYGYRPLSELYDEDGYIVLSVHQVLRAWASVLRDAMELQMPNCAFSDDIVSTQLGDSGHEIAVFSYHVPGLKWKSWF